MRVGGRREALNKNCMEDARFGETIDAVVVPRKDEECRDSDKRCSKTDTWQL